MKEQIEGLYNVAQQIDDFEILKIKINFFDTFTIEDFKAQAREVLSEVQLNEDEKENELRTKEERVIQAIDAIKSNIERNNGKYNKDDTQRDNKFNLNTARSSVVEWINYEPFFNTLLLKSPNKNALLNNANLGNILACRRVAMEALLGTYSPKIESLGWALECLRDLQETVIPALEKLGDSPTLHLLKELMPQTLSLAGVKADAVIPPTNSKEFETLLEKLSGNIFGEGEYSFSLQDSALSLIEKTNPNLFPAPLSFVTEEITLETKSEFNKISTFNVCQEAPLFNHEKKQVIEIVHQDDKLTIEEEREPLTLPFIEKKQEVLSKIQRVEKIEHSLIEKSQKAPCPIQPVEIKNSVVSSQGFVNLTKKLDNFEAYLNKTYTCQKEIEKNKEFMKKARQVCINQEESTQFKNEKDSGAARAEIIKTAKEHYHHRHAAIRVLADIIFIPLAIATAGALFFAKAKATNSKTFYVDKDTKRQEMLEEFLKDNTPKNSR